MAYRRSPETTASTRPPSTWDVPGTVDVSGAWQAKRTHASTSSASTTASISCSRCPAVVESAKRLIFEFLRLFAPPFSFSLSLSATSG